MHEPKGPFYAWSGPRKSRIVIVGEAFGQTEDQVKRPFAGSSGAELFRMLGEAMPDVAPELHAKVCSKMRSLDWIGWREEWLSAAGIAYTNVFNFRPPDNKLEFCCVKKAELGEGPYPYPALQNPGKYIRREFLGEIDRLWTELSSASPMLVVLAGNTACWATLGQTNISAIRGNAAMARVPTWMDLSGRGEQDDAKSMGFAVKVLPTYHPAGVMRQWSWRTIVVADLMKASREAKFGELRRPSRSILIDPSLADIEQWVAETLANPPPMLGCDTETAGGQITMVGFARSRSEALLIPFADRSKPGGSYWPDVWSERKARDLAERLLFSPIPKVFQNGLYDYQYLLKEGYRMRSLDHDSMLLHHSILPEMKKGLGFLASIYSGEPTWKTMRLETPDTEKRDE